MHSFKCTPVYSKFECSKKVHSAQCCICNSIDMFSPVTSARKCKTKVFMASRFRENGIVQCERWLRHLGMSFDTSNETILRSLKSISQSNSHLCIVLRSKFTVRAVVYGVSTTIYRLVSSASRRIEQFIFLTISLPKIRNSSGPRIEPWGHQNILEPMQILPTQNNILTTTWKVTGEPLQNLFG